MSFRTSFCSTFSWPFKTALTFTVYDAYDFEGIMTDMETIKSAIKKCEHDIKFAYLFGSYASGETSKTGDIDVAVFFAADDAERCFDLKLEMYAQLSRTLKRNDIDIVVMNQCRNLILLDRITRNGVVLIDRDKSFRTAYEQRILHQAIDFKQQRRRVMGV